MLTRLRQAAGEHAVYDYYVFGGNSPVARPDCAASPMTIETAPAALAFDLRCNGKDFGTNFIRRRFYRRAQVYLGGEILHTALCRHAGRIVGTCDFFLYGNVLKLEDFDAAPQWQRQGFGTAVLRQLIARGQRSRRKSRLPHHRRKRYSRGNVSEMRLSPRRTQA